MKLKSLLLFFTLFSLRAFAQNTQLDSLLKVLPNHTTENEEQFQLLMAITEIQEFTILKEGIITCDKAISLAQKLNNQKELAAALNERARLLLHTGKYDDALVVKEKSFVINTGLKDKNGMADNYLTLAMVNNSRGSKDTQKEYLDKALSLVTPDVNPVLLGRIYFNYSLHYLNINPDSSIIFANKALACFEQTGKKYWLCATYGRVGSVYSLVGNQAKAIECFNKSLEISTAENYFTTAANIYENIAWVYSDIGNYPLAIENFIKELKMSELLGDERSQAYALNNIGSTFSNINSFDKAIEYLNRQIPLSKKINDAYSLSGGYQELGSVYLKQHKYKDALDQYQEAMKISQASKDSGRMAECYGLIGDAYEKLGNYQAAFTNLQIAKQFNLKQSIYDSYCKNLLSLTRTIKNSGALPLSDNIGNNFGTSEKNKAAISYALEALEFGSKYNFHGVRYLVLFELSDLYEREGDLKKSFAYYKQYVQAKDSIINGENLTAIANLQMQYDSEKKEQQIALLNKDKALQQTELEKQKTTRNTFMGGFALVLLLAGVTLNRYRVKRKANKQIEKTLDHLKNTQEQLIQQGKLASLGKMTNDVATEIKTPLTKVNNYTTETDTIFEEYLNAKTEEEKTKSLDKLQLNLEGINQQGKLADGIVKRILLSARSVSKEK